jgi:hypothetical protein
MSTVEQIFPGVPRDEWREGRFFFMWNGRELSLHETSDSLHMNDQVEISCVSILFRHNCN